MKVDQKPRTQEALLSEVEELLKQFDDSELKDLDADTMLDMKLIFDAFPFYVILLDSKHNVLSANNAVVEILGVNLGELVGRYCPKIVHGLDVPYPGCPLEEAVEKNCAIERELFDQATKRWVKSAVYPTQYKLPDGGRVYIHFTHDITEHKKAEEERKMSLKVLKRTLNETVSAMASTLERKDEYTASHQKRVTKLATAIACELNLSSQEIEGIRVAATLHDIGKMYVPAEVLNKPGHLTDLEMSLIKGHSQAGFELTEKIPFPWDVALIILQHHERVDGSGYPHGLSDEQILLGAKILAVSDVVEAMASHRPYRPALGIDAALEEIKKNRGALYDPKVVDACLSLFANKQFALE